MITRSVRKYYAVLGKTGTVYRKLDFQSRTSPANVKPVFAGVVPLFLALPEAFHTSPHIADADVQGISFQRKIALRVVGGGQDHIRGKAGAGGVMKDAAVFLPAELESRRAADSHGVFGERGAVGGVFDIQEGVLIGEVARVDDLILLLFHFDFLPSIYMTFTSLIFRARTHVPP